MKYAMLCDIGKVRSINQDSVFAACREDVGLFLAADGMGGHSHGEKASQQIVRHMADWWGKFRPEAYGSDFMCMIEALKQTAEQANRGIYEEYNQEDICGSTMVLLFIWKGTYGVISAGDSRIYQYYKWKLRQLTADEIWENQPDLTPQERVIYWEQYHGRLYNAIGIRGEMQCSIMTDECKPGMVFLLCSDGLYKYCPENYLKKCLKKMKRKKDPQKIAFMLLKKVYETDARDNISIVLVEA